MARPKKTLTPKKILKEIADASIGHIKENQTFTTEPPVKTKNATTIDDLPDEVRGLQVNKNANKSA